MKESEKLLLKYIEGKATARQQTIVEKWYADLEVTDTSGFTDLEKQQQLDSIRQQLPGHKAQRIKLWPRIMVAASVLLIIAAGVIYYKRAFQTGQIHALTHASDISPGHTGATLTLADGRQIILSDAEEGEIAQEAGMRVTKTADGQILYQILETEAGNNKTNTLSTANGQTYVLTLPDQTKIWMNAASSLTYNTTLYSAGKRKVELTGEAYFEVAKDKKHPFVVKTANQEVEVLGTHFNINSYEDEKGVSTTLIEGSVRVKSGQSSQLLKPGQQAVNTADGIVVNEVDMESILDWKDGDFSLNEVDLKTAMRKISRWYNVEIVYSPSVPADIQTGGWISRKNKLSAVLRLMESSGLVHFKVEGRTVYVSK
ncbi:fec operon regulator FecR [Sphingobacterium spiritivorum]|uniref:Fec operon regulator FecR n=1 Tax=Sphingobacterium spiritivorum TaxID=258 RepID=A0A380CSS2_SPHSI|nr:FecR domain-containing protein [Sphingobacterium spiritivorum]SUJ26735.1 fec operon regulator FecR [Sphingobacterium spiritivorum]